MTSTQDVLKTLQDAANAVERALANPNLGPAALSELQRITEGLMAAEAMLRLYMQPMDTQTLLGIMCAAIKDFEGWAGPGETCNGVLYPHGTPAYQNKNPGNLRCDPGNKAAWNVLASGSRGGFCVFNSEATGMQAQRNVIMSVASGRAPYGNPYQIAARKHGLKSSSELTLQQYFVVRDPASDSNDPDAFAKNVGQRMGVDYRTWQLKNLIP